ncbi:MAG: hypothetical protein A3G38_01460 [Omnitrophica WOR_2 bacterium RIFCSPLOWO2_12_FULL_51_8]|nr:MAG: hypothetical protein A3G38_01460 [Omnitrophica WOR_2 bacterium RIFCSPLOWO2_12_FULL_51_8]
MDIADIKEFYFITAIENLDSILAHGLLSHNQIAQLKIRHKSIANGVIQERRKNKPVPGGKYKLHDFVNLYFNPRNAMMFKRKDMHVDMCVLGIASDLFNDRDTIVTDGNASSDYTIFYPVSSGVQRLNKNLVFARSWYDDDYFAMLRKKRAICSEILVLNNIPVNNIKQVYVSCEDSVGKIKDILQNRSLSLPVMVDGKIFFQED